MSAHYTPRTADEIIRQHADAVKLAEKLRNSDPAPSPSAPEVEGTPFVYLLNAMELAAQQKHPARHGFAAKRNAVLAHVTALSDQLAALRRTQEEDTRVTIVGEICEDCAAHVWACCSDALAARTTAPTGEEAP